MWASENAETLRRRCREALLRAIPAGSLRILEVGCGEAPLAARLKETDGRRTVFGITCDQSSAERARQRLDQVYTLDIQTEDPPIEPASLDCILYDDVLEHLIDPQEVLSRQRRLLTPQGIILCCIGNNQHHAQLTAYLKADFPYTSNRFAAPSRFTYSTFF